MILQIDNETSKDEQFVDYAGVIALAITHHQNLISFILINDMRFCLLLRKKS